jgi:hypothetical protein
MGLGERMKRRWLVMVLAGGTALGCASEAAPPTDGGDAARAWSPEGGGLSVEGAVGALDPEAVRQKADGVRKKAAACVAAARAKLPYLEGDVEVALRVDGVGRVFEAFLTRSTLGHAGAERCILEAFAGQSWPRPVGGKIGEIAQGLSFETGYPEPPAEWSQDDLTRAMASEARGDEPPPDRALLEQLSGCRREAGGGGLLVTMYLDEDGLAQGVGISSTDAKGMEAASCVSTVVQTTSFPATGKLVKASLKVP